MSEKSPTNDPTITNPKDIIGSTKIPFHLWPETASALGSLALLEGALKYGRANYRAIGVKASIYYDAARRHLNAWFEGEENAPDSGLPHLGHALACIAILVDAQAGGKLNDDRQYTGGYASQLAEITPHVARLKEKYADKSPKHYTIADSAVTESGEFAPPVTLQQALQEEESLLDYRWRKQGEMGEGWLPCDKKDCDSCINRYGR